MFFNKIFTRSLIPQLHFSIVRKRDVVHVKVIENVKTKERNFLLLHFIFCTMSINIEYLNFEIYRSNTL